MALDTEFTTKDVRDEDGGSELSDVSVIPFIRESDLDFVGYNLRPNRQVWYYFDDTEMSHFVSRPSVVALDSQKGFGDQIFNSPREEVSIAGGLATVLLSETDQTTGNTTLYLSPLRNAGANVESGNTVTGQLTNTLANVVSYQHNSGLIRSGSNSSSIILGLEAEGATANYYVGNVITVTTGTLCGQSSNIVSYNASTRIADVSPSFSASPAQNDVYSIGDLRVSYSSNTKQSHYTTNQGFIAGTLHLPDPNANTQYSFRTGDRIFRILDNPQNQLFTDGGDKAYTSRADYRYTANGLRVEETQVINRITTTNNITVTTTVFDPIAQSFFIDGNQYEEGIFVPSIDLYFRSRGENLPIQLQIRPMDGGFPDSEYVLPYAETTLQPNQVNVSDLPNVDNTLTSTTFTFPSPVYLAPDQEYAFVILTNDYGYDLWVSEVGQEQIGTGRWVSKQPYLGSMFKSQSGRTFTALQNEDVMFKINKCLFDTSGIVTFNEYKNANSRLPYQANSETYNSNNVFDFFHFQSDYGIVSGTSVDFLYRATSNATNTLDTSYSRFTPEKNTIIEDRKILFGPEHQTSFNIQMQLSTTNPDVSPVVFYNRQNLVTIRNLINNMGISNDIVSIANTGSGYTAQNTYLTFSTSSTGLQANGYITANATTGAIESVIIDNEAAGYFGDIDVTITSTDGSGGEIIVSSETDSSGGPAAARYIGKTVTLADGFDAGDLRVYLTSIKPQTANVQVYMKIRNALDSETIEQKNWIQLSQKGNEYTYSTNADPIEYEFRPSLTSNSVTYTSNTATYKTFNEFKLKVVLASSGTSLTNVPILFDVSAIALPADVF